MRKKNKVSKYRIVRQIKMYPQLSFDAAFKTLPNKIFSFTANAIELFEDTEWPCIGAKIGGDLRVSEEEIWSLPEPCRSFKELQSHILTCWHNDCKQVFVKPLNLNNLMANLTHKVDTSYPVVALTPEEDGQEWFLLWTVTKIEISKQFIQFYWAPTHKKAIQPPIEDFEVQSPEESQYRVIQNLDEIPTASAAWVQDIQDLPLSDRPALRLQTDLDQAQERARKRLRDARLRAKLAKYRADKLALQFQEKFGYYPAEDEEEAQTEYESSSGDE